MKKSLKKCKYKNNLKLWEPTNTNKLMIIMYYTYVANDL